MEKEPQGLGDNLTSDCKTVLINDQPTDIDEFGSHERVARAIAELIEEDGGKAIALVGTWGSGKSTIVELIDSKLSKPENKQNSGKRVFLFNAWAHQGDPLRRSFLESLIKFLLVKEHAEEEWINKSTWEEELEYISRRKEDTITTTEPILTNPGKLMAIALLLIPLGYALFDTISNPINSNQKLLGFLPIWVLGIIFILLPFLIVAITWMKSSEQGHSLLGLFIHKTRDIEKSTKTKTPDHTSIEFKDYFTKMMKEAIGNSERKLMIVIDNLDRIDPDEALSMWSTMRTFFELNSKSNDEWMKRFWLIVPFDPSALKRIWYREENSNSDVGKEGKSKGNSLDQRDSDLLHAFVDKTFQIKFHVAPPVMSDWKKFLFNQMYKAFPDHNKEEDFDKIYSIYRIYRIVKFQSRPPTPRDLKLFINQIGAYHRTWGDYVPLYYQALYVLYKKDIHKNYDAFIKPDFIDQKIQNLIEDDFLKWLAVLHFNVTPPEKALQIIIDKDIEDALRNVDMEKLDQLAQINGFLVVCENTVEENIEEWVKSEPETITSSACLFEVISQDTELQLSKIWKQLQNAIQNVPSWRKLDENIGSGLVAILKTSESPEYEEIAAHIIIALSNTEIIETPKEQEEPETLEQKRIQEWINGSIPVLDAIDQRDQDDLIKKNFKVPGDPTLYLEVIKELAKDKRKYIFGEFFAPKSEPKNIMSELIKQCSNGMFTNEYSECIDIMIQINGNWPWINLIAPINQRIKLENNITAPEIVGCIGTITSLAYKKAIPEANTSLEQLSNNGLLMHYLHQAQSVNDKHAVAFCIFPLLCFNPVGEIATPLGNSAGGINVYSAILSDPSNNKEVVNYLSNLFIKFNKIDDLLNKPSDAPDTKPIVKAILETIVQRDDAQNYLTPDITIENNEIIQDTLTDEELNSFIKKLVLEADFLAELTSHEFTSKLGNLYLTAYQISKDRDQSSYIDFLTDGLRSIGTDNWKTELDNEGEMFALLLYLADNQIEINLPHNFSDALLIHADQINSGKAKQEHELNNAANLLSVLTKVSRQTFLRNLYDKIVDRSTKNIERILKYYGDQLINSGVLEEKADETVRRLFSNIIARQSKPEFEWIELVIQKQPSIVTKCKNETIKDFVERLENTLKRIDADEAIRAVTENIAKAFGIDPSQFQPEKVPEDETTSEEEEEEEEESQSE